MNCYKLVSRHARLRVLLVLALMVLACGPARAQVIFNEIMADNRSTLVLDGTNNTTYFPDYIELYNTNTAAIDLTGWSLTDLPEFSNSVKYVFPAGTIIGATNYLLVFCDDKTNRAGLHTGFGLSDKGEQLFLYKSGGTEEIARQSFGIQLRGYSVGRVPDISGDFVLNLPTPAGGPLAYSTNTPVAVDTSLQTLTNSLRINEWLALNVSGSGKTNDDWFEIYNGSTNIVSLTGLVFADDDPSRPFAVRSVPPLCFIGPQGFVQIFASNKEKAADEVNFSLSSTLGDAIYILHFEDPANRLSVRTVIDFVSLPVFTNASVSRGRVPDGTANIVRLPNLSPGSRNFGRITEIIINEVLAHTDLPLEDAIELFNPTTTNVNIGDWWLTNDPDVPKKFRIPANTIVPPGGYVVFYEGRGASVGFNKRGTGNTPEFTLNSARAMISICGRACRMAN